MIHSTPFNYDEIEIQVSDGTEPTTQIVNACYLAGTIDCADNNIKRIVVFDRLTYAVKGSTTVHPADSKKWKIYVQPGLEPESLFIVSFDYMANYNADIYDRVSACSETFYLEPQNYNFQDVKSYPHTCKDPIIFKKFDTSNLLEMGDTFPHSIMKSKMIADLFTGTDGDFLDPIDWSLLSGDMEIQDGSLVSLGADGVVSNNVLSSLFTLVNHCEVELRYQHNFYGSDSSFIEFILEQDANNKFLMRLKSWSNGFSFLNTYPAHAFRVEPLDGKANGREWFAKSPSVSNECLTVNFPDNIDVDEIVVNNSHDSGLLTANGVKQTAIYMSYSENFNGVFGETDGYDVIVFNDEIPEHSASDAEDSFTISIPQNKILGSTSVKSIKFKISDNYGDTDYLGIRDISFYKGGTLIPYSDTWTCLTSDYNASNPPENAIKDGSLVSGSNWFTNIGTVTDTTLVVIFPTPIKIDEIKYSNSHIAGTETDRGAKTVSVLVNPTESFSALWDETLTGTYEIFSGVFDQHSSYNVWNTKRFKALTQITGVYTAFKMKISDNYGSTSCISLRSIEFKKDGVLIPYDASWACLCSSSGGVGYEPENVFNTSLSKTGAGLNNQWQTADTYTADQYIIVNFNTELEIDEIVINNGHDSGGSVDSGVQNYEIHICKAGWFTDQWSDESHGVPLSSGTLIQHSASDVEEDISKSLLFPTDPLIFYDFKNDYNDISGSGYNATKSQVSIVDGYKGTKNAVKFSATSGQYVAAPAVEDLRIVGDVSVSIFAKRSSSTAETKILATCATSGESLATNILFDLRFDSSGNLYWIHEYGTGGTNVQGSTMFLMELETWYHFVLTRDSVAKVYRLYVNGLEVNRQSYTTNPSKGSSGNTQYWSIGVFPGNTSRYSGLIDDFRVFDRVLTPEEIALISDHLINRSLQPKSFKFQFTDNHGGSYMGIRDIAFNYQGERILYDEETWEVLASSSNSENGGHTLTCYKVEENIETQLGSVTELTNRYGVIRLGRGWKGEIYFQLQPSGLPGPFPVNIVENADKWPGNKKTYLANSDSNIIGDLTFKVRTYTEDDYPDYKVSLSHFKGFGDDINYSYGDFTVDPIGINGLPNPKYFSICDTYGYAEASGLSTGWEEQFIVESDKVTVNPNRAAANTNYQLFTNILLTEGSVFTCTLNLGGEPLSTSPSKINLRILDFPPRIYQGKRYGFIFTIEQDSDLTTNRRFRFRKITYNINNYSPTAGQDGFNGGTEVFFDIDASMPDDIQIRVRFSGGSLFGEYYDGSDWITLYEFIHVGSREYSINFDMLSYSGSYPKYVYDMSVVHGRLLRRKNATYTLDFSLMDEGLNFEEIEDCDVWWDYEDVNLLSSYVRVNEGLMEMKTVRSSSGTANCHIDLNMYQMFEGDFDIEIEIDMTSVFSIGAADNWYYFRNYYGSSMYTDLHYLFDESAFNDDSMELYARQVYQGNLTSSIFGERAVYPDLKMQKNMRSRKSGFDGKIKLKRVNGVNYFYTKQKSIACTIEVWAKRTGGSNSGYTGEQPLVMLGNTESDSSGGFAIVVDKATGKVGVDQSYNKGTSFTSHVISTSAFDHFALVIDFDCFKFYINGVLKLISQHPAIDPWTLIYLARRGTASYMPNFNGDLTEIRIWNVARTQEELIANSTQRLTGIEEGLSLYYPMITNSGSSITDYSTNSMNMTLYGTYAWVACTLFGDGYSLRFYGDNDYAYGNHYPEIDPDPTKERWNCNGDSDYICDNQSNGYQAYHSFQTMAPIKFMITSGVSSASYPQLAKIKKVTIKSDGLIHGKNTSLEFYYDNNRILNNEYSHWISHPIPLDKASEILTGSLISWGYMEPTLDPTHGTLVSGENIQTTALQKIKENRRVYVSYDDGDTWAQCTNGDPIPGITAGMNTVGMNLLVKMVFDGGNDNRALFENGNNIWFIGFTLGIDLLIY